MSLIFGLVAGETSGDNLGAPLIRALKRQHPDARFVGIGGPAMIREGMESFLDIERLSINGFIDPIKRFPELLQILLSTRSKLLALDPVCFIGIDFNFFNLLLEGLLKNRGIKTVHYVSPTVWAWRKGRIRSIAKKVDLMLTLYPFEIGIYRENGIRAEFVGHPRADDIQFDEGVEEKTAARMKYQIKKETKLVAILPGSRSSEVAYSGPDFLRAANILARRYPGIRFIIAAANEERREQIEKILVEFATNLEITLTLGDSQTVMQAADVVLVNSGTATLEAMLLKKPMVMSYRLGALTYALVSRLVSTEFFALPNILSNSEMVPEFIQDDATPEKLADAVSKLIDCSDHRALLDRFDEIHKTLRKNSGEVAAKAILELTGEFHVSA